MKIHSSAFVITVAIVPEKQHPRKRQVLRDADAAAASRTVYINL
jgi:hypothetical protein